MFTKVKYRFIFNRRGKFDKDGKAPLTIEAYINPDRVYFTTGYKLKKEEWDVDAKQVKKNSMYNASIKRQMAALEDFELRFPSIYGRPFTLDDFKLMKSVKTSTAQSAPTFTAFAFEHIDRDLSNRNINDVTCKRYKRVIRLLAEYARKPVVEFADLTYTLIEGFDFHVRTVGQIQMNTAYKHHQAIQKYLLKAIKKGLFEIKNNPYNDFHPKKEKVESTVLQAAEMSAIEKLIFTDDKVHLDFYRDIFLLAYYTLLRISDITSLGMANLIETKEGLLLELKAQKGGKTNRVELYLLHPNGDGSSKPEQIIRKYWRTDKQPLFKRSHPRINKSVKEVVRLAGISKPIKFHTSRHSGVTYLSTKMPTAIVQQLAQHDSVRTTMGYTHISGQDVTNALRNVAW